MDYDTSIVCTYKILEKYDPEDIMYKAQLLQAFNLKSWNGDMIHTIMTRLYNKCKTSEQFKEILKLVPNRFVPDDYEMSFCILFSYHYFDITHKCLQDFFKNDTIGDENYNSMISRLTS